MTCACGGAVKTAVKTAVSSARVEDGKGDKRVALKEEQGQSGSVCNHAIPILQDGRPKLDKEPSV